MLIILNRNSVFLGDIDFNSMALRADSTLSKQIHR